MSEDQGVLLAVASRVLSYPEDSFAEEQAELYEGIEEGISSISICEELMSAIAPLYELPLTRLREQYVETFDLKENTSLYLTAHELGDSKERGTQLVLLQHIVQDAGFEVTGNQLADYIPMLLELLAVSSMNEHLQEVKSRLAVILRRILKHLPAENIYYNTLLLLTKYVFEEPASEELNRLEQRRVKADLDVLPYPLSHQYHVQ